MLQEALTNALKHGSEGTADVSIATDTGSVKMIVTNPTTGAGVERDPLSGHGLQGMRERVASVRGRVTNDCERGIFRVNIELPSIKSGAES